MNAVVISSSSDEEDNSKVQKVTIPTENVSTKRKEPPQSASKASDSGNKRLKTIKSLVDVPVSLVVLNDDGDDEEYQLDLHTKSRQQLAMHKLYVPKPLATSASTSATKKPITDMPLPKLTPKPVETDVASNMPKPLLPSLTITPITNPPDKSKDDGSEMSYLKVKNIETLRDAVKPVEVNSTLEINQSTNLFILNSDTSSSLLKNVKYVCVTTDANAPVLATDLQDAIQLANRKTNVVLPPKQGSPLFKISNVQSLATSKVPRKRKQDLDKENHKVPKSKRHKSSSSEVVLIEDDSSVEISKNLSESADIIALDSDEESTKENKTIKGSCLAVGKEAAANSGLEEVDDSQDVICIENNIDSIDICSSDDEQTEENNAKSENEAKDEADEGFVTQKPTELSDQSEKAATKELVISSSEDENTKNEVATENKSGEIPVERLTELSVESEREETVVESENVPDSTSNEVTADYLSKNMYEFSRDYNDDIEDEPNIQNVETLFEKFLSTCKNELVPVKCRLMMSKSIGKIHSRFQTANDDYLNSDEFKKLLNDKTEQILETPITAAFAFSDVLTELKNNKEKGGECSVDKETLSKIKKLERVLKILNKKIRELEQMEMSVDDDWDDDAVYIKEARYKQKSCTLYKKLCELQKKDENLGRLTSMKVNIQNSTFPQINTAVNKFYNKKRQFPNLHEIVKCIQRCVKRHKLKLSESEIDAEARRMFSVLGNKLQRRRQKETYQTLMSYPGETLPDDPAKNDMELDEKLRESRKQGNTKIEEIIDKFVRKQDLGEDTEAIENSEKSDSDNDDSSGVSNNEGNEEKGT